MCNCCSWEYDWWMFLVFFRFISFVLNLLLLIHCSFSRGKSFQLINSSFAHQEVNQWELEIDLAYYFIVLLNCCFCCKKEFSKMITSMRVVQMVQRGYYYFLLLRVFLYIANEMKKVILNQINLHFPDKDQLLFSLSFLKLEGLNETQGAFSLLVSFPKLRICYQIIFNNC